MIFKIKSSPGNSLEVQQLGLSTFTARAQGSIPGWGTKIPLAVQTNQKIKKINQVMYKKVMAALILNIKKKKKLSAVDG